MSGIEIAGIVLAALPIIISALEHYESGLDRARSFFKWGDVLEKALRELWIQHSYFELTLRNLLASIASLPQINEMMVDPLSPLWQSQELSEALEEKLGPAHKVYVHLVQEIGTQLKTLSNHLNIEKQQVSKA